MLHVISQLTFQSTLYKHTVKITLNKANQIPQILKYSVVSLTPISFPSPQNMKNILLINL